MLTPALRAAERLRYARRLMRSSRPADERYRALLEHPTSVITVLEAVRTGDGRRWVYTPRGYAAKPGTALKGAAE